MSSINLSFLSFRGFSTTTGATSSPLKRSFHKRAARNRFSTAGWNTSEREKEAGGEEKPRRRGRKKRHRDRLNLGCYRSVHCHRCLSDKSFLTMIHSKRTDKALTKFPIWKLAPAVKENADSLASPFQRGQITFFIEMTDGLSIYAWCVDEQLVLLLFCAVSRLRVICALCIVTFHESIDTRNWNYDDAFLELWCPNEFKLGWLVRRTCNAFDNNDTMMQLSFLKINYSLTILNVSKIQ